MQITTAITMMAKEHSSISKDLEMAGAPEWTADLGYILGVLLVLGIILWLCVKAIRKTLSANNSKTTKRSGAKKQATKKSKQKTSDYEDEDL